MERPASSTFRGSLPFRLRTGGACAGALLLAGCDGVQSALEPNGPAAAAIAELWWVLFVIATLVSIAVFGVLAYALFRRRDFRGVPPPLPLTQASREKKEQSGGAEGERSADERRREGSDPVDVLLDTTDSDQRIVRWILAIGGGASGMVLLGTLLYTLVTLGALHSRDARPDLTIEVIGWQWWWEVHYFDPEGRQLFETANEIHIPVGKRVRVRLRAVDVIHSFWVPQLAGKLDMIPGRTNQLWIQADEPGVYRGQCAEYCAGPHALMSMLVIAQPEEEFRAWVALQRQPAAALAVGPPPAPRRGEAPGLPGAGGLPGATTLGATGAASAAVPADAAEAARGVERESALTLPDALGQPEWEPSGESARPRDAAQAAHRHAGGGGHQHGGNVLQRGREVFLTAGCAACHAIRGTPAVGEIGPDLTHLASRRTLAAVTIPNTKGHLGGWITSPQEIKPGSKMPAVPLEPEPLLALLHYLQSLR